MPLTASLINIFHQTNVYLDDAVEYEDNDLLDDLANAILDRQEKVDTLIFSKLFTNLISYILYVFKRSMASLIRNRDLVIKFKNYSKVWMVN